MKKVLFAAVAVFAFGTANAQDMSFGAKAGLNVSNLTGDIEDTKSLIGAHVGVFAEFKITDKFSFQPELLYSMQGAKTEFTEVEGDSYSYKEESKIKLSYINIPLMAKFYVSEKFSLEAGPQVGFLMSAKNDFEISETIDGDTDSFSSEEDIKDSLKGIDFGLNLGLSYDFTENLFAGARYNLGLTDLNDTDAENFEIKNSGFQVSVGFRF